MAEFDKNVHRLDSELDLDRLADSVNANGTDLLQKLMTNSRQSMDVCDKLLKHPKLKFNHQQRSPRKSTEEAQLNEELDEFIAENLHILFRKRSHKHLAAKVESRAKKDYPEPYLPPFECFLDLPQEEEKEKFFKDVRVGDLVLARIRTWDESGIIVRLLCAGGHWQRDVDAFNLEVFIPRSELVKEDYEQPETAETAAVLEKYAKKQLIRAEILSVVREGHKLVLGILSASDQTQVGIVNEDELPHYYRAVGDYKGQHFDLALRRSTGYRNPNLVGVFCEDLGLEPRGKWHRTSFQPILNCAGSKFADSEFATDLRKVQSNKLAMKSVAKGVERFRDGQMTEALQHLERALTVDPDNVEGLVARGALLANRENFDKAIADFETARKLNPKHVNARKYLIETLLAKAKSFEGKKRKRGGGWSRTASDSYKRVLELDPRNGTARRALESPDERKTKRPRRTRSSSSSEESVISLSSDDETKGKKKEDVEIVAEFPAPGKHSTFNADSPKKTEEEAKLEERLKNYYRSYTRAVSETTPGEDEDPQLLSRLKSYYHKYEERILAPEKRKRSKGSREESLGKNGRKEEEEVEKNVWNQSRDLVSNVESKEDEAEGGKELKEKLENFEGFIQQLKMKKK